MDTIPGEYESQSGEDSISVDSGRTLEQLQKHASSSDKFLVTSDDILLLYRQARAAQKLRLYREAFRNYRATLPYLGTVPIVWIRIQETIVHALYEVRRLKENSEGPLEPVLSPVEAKLFEMGTYHRMLIPSVAEDPKIREYEKEGMTLEFAGQAACIACSQLSKTTDTELYKHALSLATFIFLRQGRISAARLTTSLVEPVTDYNNLLQAEMKITSGLRTHLENSSSSEKMKELRAGNIDAAKVVDRTFHETLKFDTVLGYLALGQFDKAFEVWKTMSSSMSQDVRCLGVYVLTSIGQLIEARNLMLSST